RTGSGMTVDLSPTGAFLASDHPLPVKTGIDLIFAGGPFQVPLRISGRVTRIVTASGRRQAGMVVEFNSWDWDAPKRSRFFAAAKGLALQVAEGANASGLVVVAECSACGWRGRMGKYSKVCPVCRSRPRPVAGPNDRGRLRSPA